jgi:hypothetical protein
MEKIKLEILFGLIEALIVHDPNMDSMEHTPRNIINKSQPDMNKKNSEELYKKLKSIGRWT